MSKYAVRAAAIGFVASLAVSAALAQAATPDVAAGGVVFTGKCSGCHSDVSGKNGIGPSLFGVYGRTAGTAAGYSYSAGLKASGIVWTADTLTTWLDKPKGLVPGTKMSFAPPTNPIERANLIAYLKSKT